MYPRERIKAIRLMELVKTNPSYGKALKINCSMKKKHKERR